MKTYDEILNSISKELNGIPKKYDELYEPDEDHSHFPKRLLDLPKEDRIEYFDSKRISHKNLDQITKKILTYCSYPVRPIGLVIGPTNVGKTTILEKVVYSLTMQNIQKMEENAGYIPVGFCEALNSVKKIYPWNYVYKLGYEMLNEGLTKRGISPSFRGDDTPRMAFIKALKHRDVKIFQFDEAHNLIYAADIQAQHDELKTCTNLVNTHFLLYGTYDLIQFINPNSQLGLRTIEYHFQRYLPLEANEEDFSEFCKVLINFQNFLPVDPPPNLYDKAEFFYFHSAGCIGLLKRWFLKSLSDALYSNEKGISEACFRRNSEPEGKLLTLANEISVGERFFKEQSSTNLLVEEQIEKKLGIVKDAKQENYSQNQSKRTRRNKPFRRKPCRDPLVPNQ